MASGQRPVNGFSRHYYIQKIYQSKMIIKFCMLAVLGTAFFCVSFYFSLEKDMGTGFLQAHEGLRLVKEGVVRSFLISEGATVTIMGVAIIIITLLMSHRIAGPLWRIEQTAKAVGSGDLALSVKLRQNDEMVPLADKMNDMISELRDYVEELRAGHELLERDITLLKERESQGDVPTEELEAVARDILAKSKSLVEKLEDMKTN